MVFTRYNPLYNQLYYWLDVCIYNAAGSQTNCTTSRTNVYMVQLVVQWIVQQVALCIYSSTYFSGQYLLCIREL